jgi:hypothetical protein
MGLGGRRTPKKTVRKVQSVGKFSKKNPVSEKKTV